MLSPKSQYSLRNAKEYFKEHLKVGDYYTESERVNGIWFGKGAELLQLSGIVQSDEFQKLCEGINPNTGESLTQRLKTTRREADEEGKEREVANRRVFFDFTFSPPKSVSIAALVGKDSRIIEANQKAVLVAMGELEKFASTRVRTKHANADRITENVVCAIFQHETSRALDPHLHNHCILFNATFDKVEGRWKALQNYQMLVAGKYVEGVYYHELARALGRLGYAIKNKPQGDFEIQGISKEICETFSKRHREIHEKTAEFLKNNPEKAQTNLQEIRERIAHKDRSRKMKGSSREQLESLWGEQLNPEKLSAIAEARTSSTKPQEGKSMDADGALAWAEEHLFDRHSVVHEHELWRHALEHGRGQEITVEEIQARTKERDYIRDARIPSKVTSREALEREMDIVCQASGGIGKYQPFSTDHAFANPNLDQDQRQAVLKILNSRDFMTLFRGGAGTGKSYALGEIGAALREAGYPIQIIAPQRQQAIAFERDGFAGAQTVKQFLTRQTMAKRSVIIVDEAGQIGGKQMQELLRLVSRHGGRIILSGDTRQHGAVEASDALRAIEKYSGIKAAELTEIRRQDPGQASTEAERKWLTQYKHAVREASEGKVTESFDRLNRQGAIVECSRAEQQERLAEEFLKTVETGQSTVVVSQTWSEIHGVNERIRLGLKSRGLVSAVDHQVATLVPLDLTNAQKRDERSFNEEKVLVWNRPPQGSPPGQTGRFIGIVSNALVAEWNGKVRAVPFKHLDRLTVCQPRELALSQGDRLQLKANGRTKRGQRLANGELVTVERIEANGRIVLQDKRILEKEYRQFVRGYAVTSYASQGKTVDFVLFSDSAVKPATNRRQWYVTISRGRKGIRIFTSDKAQLRENVVRSGDRELALDLTTKRFLRRLGISQRLVRGLRRVRTFAVALRNNAVRFVNHRANRIRRDTPNQEPQIHIRP